MATPIANWVKAALRHSKMRGPRLAEELTERLGRQFDRSTVQKMSNGTRAVKADEMRAIEAITGLRAPGDNAGPMHAAVEGRDGVRAFISYSRKDNELDMELYSRKHDHLTLQAKLALSTEEAEELVEALQVALQRAQAAGTK